MSSSPSVAAPVPPDVTWFWGPISQLRTRAGINVPRWPSRRPAGEARGGGTLDVLRRRATKPAGMDRRPDRYGNSCSGPKYSAPQVRNQVADEAPRWQGARPQAYWRYDGGSATQPAGMDRRPDGPEIAGSCTKQGRARTQSRSAAEHGQDRGTAKSRRSAPPVRASSCLTCLCSRRQPRWEGRDLSRPRFRSFFCFHRATAFGVAGLGNDLSTGKRCPCEGQTTTWRGTTARSRAKLLAKSWSPSAFNFLRKRFLRSADLPARWRPISA